VSKATGIPWARIAALIMLGKKLSDFDLNPTTQIEHVSVKASVFPFSRFTGADTVLGPEMKSTGEVMGVGRTFGEAFYRALEGAGIKLPRKGRVFLSIANGDKPELLAVAKGLKQLGFTLVATSGTAAFLDKQGIESEIVRKVREGSPHILDEMGEGRVQLVINTPEGVGTHLDSRSIRLIANEIGIPTLTTMAAALAAVDAMRFRAEKDNLGVNALQDFYSCSLAKIA